MDEEYDDALMRARWDWERWERAMPADEALRLLTERMQRGRERANRPRPPTPWSPRCEPPDRVERSSLGLQGRDSAIELERRDCDADSSPARSLPEQPAPSIQEPEHG